jgi:hypothetical protein
MRVQRLTLVCAASWLLFSLAGLSGQLPGTAKAAGLPAGVKTAPRPEPEPPNKGGIEFEMSGKPMEEVLEWFADQSGLPYVTSNSPVLGPFTYVGPKGARYTIAEIAVILNQQLTPMGYVLIRREHTFILVWVGTCA